jgi:hypothetical protein
MLVAYRSLPHTSTGKDMRLPLRLPSAVRTVYRGISTERISRGWVMAVTASVASALANAGLLGLAARLWRRDVPPRAGMPESPHGDS